MSAKSPDLILKKLQYIIKAANARGTLIPLIASIMELNKQTHQCEEVEIQEMMKKWDEEIQGAVKGDMRKYEMNKFLNIVELG